jgi:excisionase family DNA binding protein
MFTRTRFKGFPGTTPPDRRGSVHGHQEPAFLTAKEAAAILGVNVRTVRAWVEEEKLPAFRTPGGCLRIPADAVRDIR